MRGQSVADASGASAMRGGDAGFDVIDAQGVSLRRVAEAWRCRAGSSLDSTRCDPARAGAGDCPASSVRADKRAALSSMSASRA